MSNQNISSPLQFLPLQNNAIQGKSLFRQSDRKLMIINTNFNKCKMYNQQWITLSIDRNCTP